MVVDALLPKKRRGRPRKNSDENIDFQRAAIVIHTWLENPYRFKNRKSVIEYLSALDEVVNQVSKSDASARLPFDISDWKYLFRHRDFPSLVESVSRGMNTQNPNGQALRLCEKVVKKSR